MSDELFNEFQRAINEFFRANEKSPLYATLSITAELVLLNHPNALKYVYFNADGTRTLLGVLYAVDTKQTKNWVLHAEPRQVEITPTVK